MEGSKTRAGQVALGDETTENAREEDTLKARERR
jgi:hypothetical protein